MKRLAFRTSATCSINQFSRAYIFIIYASHNKKPLIGPSDEGFFIKNSANYIK